MDMLYDRSDYFGYRVIEIVDDELRRDGYIEDLSMSYYLDDHLCALLVHNESYP